MVEGLIIVVSLFVAAGLILKYQITAKFDAVAQRYADQVSANADYYERRNKLKELAQRSKEAKESPRK